MRELEASLQQFGEFILKAQLVKEKAAPYCVRWVRRFLARPASDEPLVDQVRRFCESLERESWQDWQVHQAEQALRIYFVNFLNRTDWLAPPSDKHCRGRGGPHEPVGSARATSNAHQDPALLVPHGGQLRRLGAALSRLPRRT